MRFDWLVDIPRRIVVVRLAEGVFFGMRVQTELAPRRRQDVREATAWRSPIDIPAKDTIPSHVEIFIGNV